MRWFVKCFLLGAATPLVLGGVFYIARESDRKASEGHQAAKEDAASEEAVLRHPFWAHTPTRNGLNIILARLTHPATPEAVAVDSEGAISEIASIGGFSAPTQYPADHNKPWVIVATSQDRAAVLASLKRALDRKTQREDYRKRFGG